MAEDRLTGADYASRPLVEIALHPDYNRHASRIMAKILELSSDEITQLDTAVLGILSRRRK